MNETFEDVLTYMDAHESGDAEEAFFDRVAWRELIVRLRAAHEREMATLKAALKPVLECPRISFKDIVDGTSKDAINSVREAQRIAKEGGVK